MKYWKLILGIICLLPFVFIILYSTIVCSIFRIGFLIGIMTIIGCILLGCYLAEREVA